MSTHVEWATPLNTFEDDTQTPSLVHSAQSQVLSTRNEDTYLPRDSAHSPESDQSNDSSRGLPSLPTQQMMTIADGMGKIGPEYHFERRTAQAEAEEVDGPISLNEGFNPPPLEALPSDMSIGQIQGIRPSASVTTRTPGPMLARGIGLTPTSSSERYITPPPQLGRHDPRTSSSGARTHPDLQPDGEDTPTYSLNSPVENTPTPSITIHDREAQAPTTADHVREDGHVSPQGKVDGEKVDSLQGESPPQSRPFEPTETKITATESGWQTIDSNDDENVSPELGAGHMYLSDIDIMREALAKASLTDKPRLTLGESNDARADGVPDGTQTVKNIWRDTVSRKVAKPRLHTQLGLEDWEKSESGKLPNYLRREHGERLDVDISHSTTSPRLPQAAREGSFPSKLTLPDRPTRETTNSRRTSFLLLEAEPLTGKRARPISSTGSWTKEVKRTRSISSEITKRLIQVKQRNHGGWVSPSVNRKSGSALRAGSAVPPFGVTVTPPNAAVEVHGVDKAKRRGVGFFDPLEAAPDDKSPRSFWSRLRSLSVDVLHARPVTQIYAQSTSRDIRPQESFVDLGSTSTSNTSLLPHSTSRSLGKRLSIFAPKPVEPQPTSASEQRYRLPKTPDRDKPLKQVPDPFKRLGPDDNPLASPVTTVIDDGDQDESDRRKLKHDGAGVGVLDGLKRTFSTIGTSARSISTRRTARPRSKIEYGVQAQGQGQTTPPSTQFTAKSKAKAEKLLGERFDISSMDPYYATVNPVTGPPGRLPEPEHATDSNRPSQESLDPHEIFRDFDWPGPPPRPSSRVSSNGDVPSLRGVGLTPGSRRGATNGRPISAAQEYALEVSRRASAEGDRDGPPSLTSVRPRNILPLAERTELSKDMEERAAVRREKRKQLRALWCAQLEKDGPTLQNWSGETSSTLLIDSDGSFHREFPPEPFRDPGGKIPASPMVKRRRTVAESSTFGSEERRYYRKTVENGITITFSPSILQAREERERAERAELKNPMPELIKSFSDQTTSTDLVTNGSQQSQSVALIATASTSGTGEVDEPERTQRQPTAEGKVSVAHSSGVIESRQSVRAGYPDTPSPDSPGITRSAPINDGNLSDDDPLSPHPDQRRLTRHVVDSPLRFAIPRPEDGVPTSSLNSTAPLGESKRQKSTARTRLSSLGDKFRFRKRSSENTFNATSAGEMRGLSGMDEGIRGRNPTARASRATSNPVPPPLPPPQHSSSFSLKHMLDAVNEAGDKISLHSKKISWFALGDKLMDHLPEEPMESPHQAQRALEAMDQVLSPDLGAGGVGWGSPRDWKVAEKETDKMSRSQRDSDVIPALLELWGGSLEQP